MCHRSSSAYPYLVATELHASLLFPACSGALARHITGVDASGHRVPGQYPKSPSSVLGGRAQLDVLRDDPKTPAIVLLDVGGNDAGFGTIGQGCVLPTAPDCRRSAQYWMDQLESKVYPAIVRTLKAVKAELKSKAPAARLFVLTYPDPLGPGDCSKVRMTAPELGFLRDALIPRLNALITFAADTNGIETIHLEDALVGHRLCEVPFRDAAVNFVTLSRTKAGGIPISKQTLTGLIQGTFHPNVLGHRLISKVVLAAIAASPAASPAAPPPPPPGLPVPDVPPPFVPPAFGVPVGPYEFPAGTRCTGPQIERITPIGVDPSATELAIEDLLPSSRVCYRDYENTWHHLEADGHGAADVPLRFAGGGLGSINEILVESSVGWQKLVVQTTFVGGQPDQSVRLVWTLAGLGLGFLLLVALPLCLLVHHRVTTRRA